MGDKREWAANASLTEVHLFRVMPRGRYWGRSACGRVRLHDEPFWSIPEDWDDARAMARDHASYRPLPVCVDCTHAAAVPSTTEPSGSAFSGGGAGYGKADYPEESA